MAHKGVHPSNAVQAITASMPAIGFRECNVDALREHQDSPAWILKAIESCGDGLTHVQTQPF